jgi:hypothetical protein
MAETTAADDREATGLQCSVCPPPAPVGVDHVAVRAATIDNPEEIAMKLRRNHACAAIAALVAAATFGHATAGSAWTSYDRMTISGAQCQPSTGSQWPDFVVNPDGIRNMHPAYSRYISCAIPFQSENAIDQSDFSGTTAAGAMEVTLALDYSQVAVGSNHRTDCTLFGRNGGSVAQSDVGSVQSAKTADLQYIAFGASSALQGINISSHATQVVLNCRLPPKVKLTNIKTYEHGETGNYYYTP